LGRAMSEQQRQHVSALIDGEIDTRLLYATLSALETNGGLKAVWERYHLIGAAMRSEPVREEYCRIAALVSARVAREPVPLQKDGAPRGRVSRLGAFVGAAVAAVAAFFAIFAMPQFFDPTPSIPESANQQIALNPPVQFLLSSPTHRWHVDEPALEDKLDRFLVNHQEQSPASGIKGFLPYATVVGYEAGR
jgi:sigma-E factor negative regulatory protein RseA